MKNIFILSAVFLLGIFLSCKKNDLHDSQLSGVTFTRIISSSDDNYELDGNIVDYDEIIGYDQIRHIFLLSENAGERIREEAYPVTPTKFAIAVDGELIYIANFIPGYSSISCVDCITVEPYSYDNKYRVALGYPGSEYYTGNDPRNDGRIISKLQRDHKLIEIE